MEKKRVAAWIMIFMMIWQMLPITAIAEGIQIRSIPIGETYYTATFYDDEDEKIDVQYVESGKTPVEPQAPQKANAEFKGWDPELGPMSADTDFYPTYNDITTYTVVINYVTESQVTLAPSIVRSFTSKEVAELLDITPTSSTPSICRSISTTSSAMA